MPKQEQTVGLFVTCLVDLFRPNIAFSVVKLLETTGWTTVVPRSQTCCGQPAYNSGDRRDARRIARRVIRAFEDFDYVVVPSGSCAAMIKLHYPELFKGDRRWAPRAEDLAGRTYEYVTFLDEVVGVRQLATRYDGTCAYHDSCSSLRELGIKETPRSLLGRMGGVKLKDLDTAEVCCGFGGAFCVKYPEISNHMVADKAADIAASGADTLIAADLGCLLNIAGKLRRDGNQTRVFHIAEVLAGMAQGHGIGGEPEAKGAPKELPKLARIGNVKR
ncbi:MAG: (Fe-S)-binding protein [Alphaproteobacteria bacterium]|nr:(Fe-S)-binding protein [Alphaproteobacteria bacterium]